MPRTVFGGSPLWQAIDVAPLQRALQQVDQTVAGLTFDHQHLGRITGNNLPGRTLRIEQFGDAEFTGRNVDTGDAVTAVFIRQQRHQVIVASWIQGIGVNNQTGGYNPDNRALDNSLGLLGVFHLFADRDLMTILDQFGDIRLAAVKRHATKRNFRFCALVSRRQGDIENARRNHSVFHEHFIEIAKAKEENRIRIFRLDLQVLLHHGCGFCHQSINSTII